VAVCLGLVLALGVGAAAADEAPIAIETAVGFSDTFRPGHRTPITVTVSNHGAGLSARLQVVSTDGDTFRGQVYRVVHERRLELPRGARKRFHFAVHLAGLADPLSVRVVADGRELARRDLDLRRRFTAERLLLVVSRDVDLDYLNDPGGRGLRVAYPHPDRLPHRWQGYDGVSALVLHGLSLERLAPAQYEALRRWVVAGGVLAVSGGPDYTLLRGPRYAALLPALPAGAQQVDDGGAVSAALGLGAGDPAPLLVHRLGPLRGRVLHAAGGMPLVVEERRGRGRVLYLTFDVSRAPFDRGPGMTALWQRLLAIPAGPVQAPMLPQAAAQGVHPVKALLGGEREGFPGHGTVLVFLALYLGLLAAGHRLEPASAVGRRPLPLLTWAAPVLFAPAAWLLFGPLLFQTGAAAVAVTTISPLPRSAYARLHLDLGLYGARHDPLRLAYAGAEPAFRVPVRWRVDAGAGAWVFDEDPPPAVEPLDGRPFVLHLLEGDDVVPFDLRATLRRDGDGLALRLRNGHGWPLTDAWLIAGGRAFALGEVAAGAALERRLPVSRDALRVDEGGWSAVLSRWRGLRQAEREAARAVLVRHGVPGPGEALLVARTRSPVRLAPGAASWRRTELSLLLARLSLASAAAEAVP
jgi:hypothetical protein